MQSNFTINQEYSNNKKIITVQFLDLKSIKENQLKMILNNDDINGLLTVKFKQTEDKAFLYYDTENKQSLFDKFLNKKMSLSEFIAFCKSLFSVMEELENYFLVSKGIFLDSHYIFYDEVADSYEYIHLPVEEEDIEDKSIDKFILSVFNSYYGDLNSNFSNEIGIALNNLSSIEEIKQIVNKYDDKSIFGRIKNGIEEIDKEEYEDYDDENFSPKLQINSGINKGGNAGDFVPKKPNINKNNDIKDKKKNKNKNKNKNTEAKPKAENKNSVKYYAFGAIQVVGLAVIAKIAMNGIETNKIIVMVIILVAIDIILAKNLFFKASSEKPKKEKIKKEKVKKEKAPKELNKKKVTIPNKKEEKLEKEKLPVNNDYNNVKNINQVEMPTNKKINESINIEPNINKLSTENAEIEPLKQNNNSNIELAPSEEKVIDEVSFECEKTMYMPMEEKSNDDDFEMAETVIMKTDKPIGYIEIYDKDDVVLDKYIITNERTVIGRLKSQVNLQIKNPKVGKIHAELIYENNEFYIRDICTLNGTYVGEEKKKTKQNELVKINSGDTVYLADSKIKVYSI